MGRVMTVLNQKGGVGKTSTCHHLAGYWGAQGQRVLLVDNDPQASLTQVLLRTTAARRLRFEETVAAVYEGQVDAPAVMRAEVMPGVDLIPSTSRATRYNHPEPMDQPWPRQLALRTALEPTRAVYDHILIDCAPNLHLCSWAALAAADGVLVPVQPEDFGAQGTIAMRRWIRKAQRAIHPTLRLYGFVLTMVSSRRSVHQLYEETLRAELGAALLSTRIPYSTDFPESVLRRQAVTTYKPRGVAARAVVALARELARITDGAAAEVA